MRQHMRMRGLLWILMVCGISSGIVTGDARARGGVALLDSEFTHKIYQKQKANYRLLFGLWYEALQRQGLDFDVLRDRDLERGNLQSYSALVLPGSVAMSDPEWQAVQRFVQSGGGLLLGGAAGTLSPDGKWRGWERIKEFAGLREIKVLSKSDYKSLYLTFRGGLPSTLSIPAGLRIENVFYNENYAGLSDDQDAYWSTLSGPLYVSDHRTYYTAIKTARYGQGRVAWFGFNLESMNEQPENQRSLLALFGNTLRWLKQEPLAQVALWPQGQTTAVSLTFDCENDFENLTHLINRRDVSDFRFTFFMLSSMAEPFPEIVRRTAQMGEVAIHGDDHSIFRGQSYETQLQRLARAKEKLEALSGREIISFRPPLQRFDGNTLLAMRDLGIKLFFSDYVLSSMPYFQPVKKIGEKSSPMQNAPDTTLITFPRPNYDDYDLFVRYQLSNDQAIEYIMEDFSRVDHARGLYVLNMHTTSPWGGLTRHRIRVLSTLIQRLTLRKDIWFPTIREAGEWWALRANVTVRVTKEGDDRLGVEISNENDKPLDDLAVEVYLPAAYSDGPVRGAATNAPASWDLDRSAEKLTLRIPTLGPREVKRYVLMFQDRREAKRLDSGRRTPDSSSWGMR